MAACQRVPTPPESKAQDFSLPRLPVIYGEMAADWHYYRLIAPHSGSSPFEDQSGRVPLCVPTLINPE